MEELKDFFENLDYDDFAEDGINETMTKNYNIY